MGNIHTTGPDEALVISGGFGSKSVRTVVGGWGWAWWLISDVQKMNLTVISLSPKCEDVETSEGVPVTVTGIAQVKIMRDKAWLRVACEQFLGKSHSQVKQSLLQTLEGHLRAILGTLSVESIYSDRELFAKLVREVASPDVGKMGIEILSFTIKDICDNVDYLDSLGRTKTADVKRDAEIGTAEAKRDAEIQESECERNRLNICYSIDAEIANFEKELSLQKCAFDVEVNSKRAEFELAYQLQEAKEKQKIRVEEVNIDVIKQRIEIEIKAKEIQCAEKEISAQVRYPADAESYRLQQIAEGERTQNITIGQAEADVIRIKGLADASSTKAVGEAEAESLKLNAESYLRYGDSATLKLILDALPGLASQVAAPLENINEIVMLNNPNGVASNTLSNLGNDLVNMLSTTPHALKALTNLDMVQALSKIPGATASR